MKVLKYINIFHREASWTRESLIRYDYIETVKHEMLRLTII